MKKKLIVTLTVLLVLSNVVPMTVYAEEVSNENIQTQNDNIDISKIKEDIKEKANIIISKDSPQYSADSVQYAICDGDNMVLSDNAVYSKRTDNKVSEENMYGIGSISKMFTTAAVMQLVDEKKIDLDLPVINYMPEFTMQGESYKKITPRMLLNHSSGIDSMAGKDGLLLKDPSTEKYDNLLETLSKKNLLSEPGQYCAYSNGGFLLAQRLVEKISGMSFPEYIEKNISSPLGLKHTKTPKDINDTSYDSLLANTYTCSDDFKNADDRGLKEFVDLHETPADGVGAAGVFCSAEDLCKFGSNLVRKDGKGILSPRSVELMGEKEYLKGLWVDDPDGENRDNNVGYGLGWDCVKLYPFNKYGIKAYVKHGSTLFYHSCLIALPDLNITMAANVSGGSSDANEAFVISALLDVLKSKGIIENTNDLKKTEEKSQSMPSEYINKFGGVYNYGYKTANAVISSDGTLTLTDSKIIDNKDKKETDGEIPEITTLNYCNSGYFMNKNGDFGVKFVEEENGKIYMEQKSYKSYPGLSEYANDCYVAQKMEDNSNKAYENSKDIWKNRSNKPYYILNAKYSSALYAGQMGYGFTPFEVDENGYINGSKIISENIAVPGAQIPGVSTMMYSNFEFKKEEDGIEYLNYNGAKFISSDNIGEISENTNSIEIGEDGFTKWFKIPGSMNGKTMTVTCKDKSQNTTSKAAFCVYSADDKCVNDSYVSGINTVTLKEGDVIAFVGGEGNKFEIAINIE